MELRNILTRLFSSLENGKMNIIKELDPAYPAFVLKTNDAYGVAIEYNGIPVNESFNSVTLVDNSSMTTSINFGANSNDNYLMLLCSNNELRGQFAQICADFVYPDVNGINRKLISNDAVAWWKTWQSLLGNMAVDAKPYSVVSELYIYKMLLDSERKAFWGGPDSSSHDIMLDDIDIEVKASMKKYESIVHIAGEYQLEDNGKTLYLCFCRLERQEAGESIDSLVDYLVQKKDVSRVELNRKLKKIGYPEGNSARRERYVFLDLALYLVDKSFPRIVKKNQTLWPDAFSRIEYELNLASLPRIPVIEYGESRNILSECICSNR